MSMLTKYYPNGYPKLVMFDLDGTLVDTVPDIAIAVNKTLTLLGLPTVKQDKVRLWVGNGADMLIRRALTNGDDSKAVDKDLWDKAIKTLLAVYPYHHDVKYVYAGVKPYLEFLDKHGIKMAVVTNKPIAFVEPLLKELTIAHNFSWLVGGGSLPQKKPDPEPLLYVLQKAGVRADETLFVGDSCNDIRAAKAAKVPCAALTYGYNHGKPIADEHPTWIIDDLRELI